MSKNTKNQELRDLIVQAFADAKAKGKPDWQRMNLGVLKNRLLHRTNKRFRESDYGGGTMLELVERFPDLLALGTERPPSVSILVDVLPEAEDEAEADTGRGPRDAEDEGEEFQATLDRYRTNGDTLGLGEAYASQLPSVDEVDLEKTFVNIITWWASSSPVDAEINTVADLLEHIDKFVIESLALATLHATLRMADAGREPPARVGDLNYRVAPPLRSLLGLATRSSPSITITAATVKARELSSALDKAVQSFCQSTAVAAKLPSTDVIKHAHAYDPYALPGERQTLRDVETLLGTVFRKFCESCERYEAEQIPMRARDLTRRLQRTLDGLGGDVDHRLQTMVLEPVAKHMSRLIEEGTQASDEMMKPALSIVGGTFKLDLGGRTDGIEFPARVVNDGDGTAHSVSIQLAEPVGGTILSASEPSAPFDLPPHTERLIQLKLSNAPSDRILNLHSELACQTANERPLKFKQYLELQQQRVQPDWDELLKNPPYAINPIREKKDLYGRDSVLAELELHVSNETSTFLWGQKRVGKTSVLQVLAANLSARDDIACIVLRMGELASLHEGQLGHTVATRLISALGIGRHPPAEDDFRAGLGRLVPYVDELAREVGRKMVVIIDEFDDLNPAFYLGERGKQFVKALRSLSEVGLTFMFVGSERMNSIYHSHSADLNKWINSSLDRIEVDADCEALLIEPVAGKIEYEHDAVKRIVEYCRGNPFYMHLVAGKVFRRCAQEQRTYLGTSDFDYVRRSLVRELGPTNFAHLWEDVPVLDPNHKQQSVARNCLFLVIMARLGSGEYESIDDLVEAQKQLDLEPHEQLSSQDLREVQDGLIQRRVISRRKGDSQGYEIALPIFCEWLLESGEAELMPVWRSVKEELAATGPIDESTPITIIEPAAFPITEDDLLSVSERLVYLGRQIDVAEVRRWLRQFDDDSRIEVAFMLLKRLTESGFVNDGASVNGLAKMDNSLNARRQDVGDGAWRIFRRRKDNLYLGHVDSDTKSGAATARELAKRMSPGKCGHVRDMYSWAQARLDNDPILVIVDDFAGTGNTLVQGLKELWSLDDQLFSKLAQEGRVVCCLQTAFPEALLQLQHEFPKVNVLTMDTFDDQVKAFAPDAGIFEDDSERVYAEEVMFQIGQQLTPQHPLGFGDMAALVSFHNTIPNNTLPVFWSSGRANGREWQPLLPRGSFLS